MSWSEQIKLEASDKYTNDEFEYNCNLSNDGNYALTSTWLNKSV